MMSQTDTVISKLKKLKTLSMMPVFKVVEAEIQGFFDSLPIMKELKSDTLRYQYQSKGIHIQLDLS